MELLAVPRFIVSGVAPGVGKSLLCLGLSVALRKRNLSLSCCVISPNLTQAVIHKRISGRYVRCLDEKILSAGQILSAVHHAGVGADIVMIEGNAGLYDGWSPGSLRGSDAEIASITKSPVILVADVRGFGNSLVALLKGYCEFAKGFDVAGVIANRIQRGDEVETQDKVYFDCALQAAGLSSLLGAVPEIRGAVPMPRMLASQNENKTSLPRQFIVDVGNLVSDHIDVDGLIMRANNVASVRFEDYEDLPSGRRCKIALSDDSCFSVGFQDNLDLLKYYGAELVAFSPLADMALPRKIGGIYISGAYLNEYGRELAANESMKQSIREFADSGGIIYTEGGGSAYLCSEFQPDPAGEILQGVGIIPACAVYEPKETFSYADSVTVEESVFGRQGLIVKGISTGEWRLKSDAQLLKALRISVAGNPAYQEGYSPGAQILSTFMFAHWGSNPIIAKNIVDGAEVVKRL